MKEAPPFINIYIYIYIYIYLINETINFTKSEGRDVN